MSERELADTKKDLRVSEQARKRLLNHLFYVEEEERHKLAADLHDDTIQAMAATLLMMDSAHQEAPSPSLVRAQLLLRGALERTRTMMFEMAPAVLAHHGLKPALEGMSKHVATEMGATIECDAPAKIRFDPATEMLAFRVVRECLANAKKHSHAKHVLVNVNFMEHKDKLYVSVIDNGRGFDMERHRQRVMSSPTFKHIGLLSMIERVELTGGSAEVRSEPGLTRLNFWIPAKPTVQGY